MIAIGHHDTIKITRQRISNFASAFEAEALALNEALVIVTWALFNSSISLSLPPIDFMSVSPF